MALRETRNRFETVERIVVRGTVVALLFLSALRILTTELSSLLDLLRNLWAR